MVKYRLVLADDHVLLRQGLKKLIDGVEDLDVVGEAGNGMELLTLFGTARPDLVILDISMPNLRGIEALRIIKRDFPKVKVLVLTMYKEYLHQALAGGADGYLIKEDADSELYSAISHIRHGKTYVSPRLRNELDESGNSSVEPLSARETEVLKLIAKGQTSREIAEVLFISVRTVESHRASIMDKLHIKNTAELVRYAIEKGYR